MDSSGKRVWWQFHFHINNMWVGGIGSTIRLLFKQFFPIVVAVNISVLCLSRYCSVEDLNNKRWNLSTASAGSERPDQ